MRICFVQPSLESGRDGVADYVARLSSELKALGHECFSIVPAASGTAAAEAQLSAQPVDWLSLQWVPFGFDNKGMPGWLVDWIDRIGVLVQRRHWMFHELWLGLSETDSLRYRLWGFRQRRLTQQLLRRWQPRCIHTQCYFYRSVLTSHGVQADLLPLFGNVPIVAGSVSPLELLRPYPEDEWLRMVHFGRVHPQLDLESMGNNLRARVGELGKQGLVVFAGRTLRSGDWLNALNQRFGPELVFTETGELGPDQLSRLFRQCDWGLSSTPWQLTDKSGSVAALTEHGLPVLVWRDDFRGRQRFAAEPADFAHCYLVDKLSLRESASLHRHPPQSRLAPVARQFIEDLKACAF